MKKAVQVSIVHDELGRIKSINRPAHGAKVIVLSGSGESVLVTEVGEESIKDIIRNHRVDVSRKALVKN
jgi:hypothetical protein